MPDSRVPLCDQGEGVERATSYDRDEQKPERQFSFRPVEESMTALGQTVRHGETQADTDRAMSFTRRSRVVAWCPAQLDQYAGTPLAAEAPLPRF
ncbi:unnamed protein product [Nezara viridula]|uniref:Uncharacterized protein n=1 Tax=Nezara viridula TaxID=85310 RepID=A0A9P0E5H7_NEZVI|nr:unnamed protein product [Nezara viridula]